MPKFTDTDGREWSLRIDVFLLDWVQRETGFRIDKLLQDGAKALVQLGDEPVLFVRVLWLLIENQAKAKGVSPEQFGRSMAGDALEEAARAFMEAYALFCPSRQRTIVRTLAAKTDEKLAQAQEISLKAIAALDSSSSPTSSPASSESTPPAAG